MIIEPLAHLVDQFVVVAGHHFASQIETDPDPDRIDHVWITVDAAAFGRVRISLNTCSLKSRRAGLDPRMWTAAVVAPWDALPSPGVRTSSGFDYKTFETASSPAFIVRDRAAMETMFLDRAKRSTFIEAWGELYDRGHVGLHQVHSRHASPVVRTHRVGRDGAIRFYFDDATSETLLLKFWGQN